MIQGVRQKIGRIPVLGPALKRIRQAVNPPRFPGTKAYWETRYASGGSSGEGSYGHLALFKARTLNHFVEAHQIKSVIEFGCGDGNQLSLSEYPSYIGLDISSNAIERCRARFSSDHSKHFALYDPAQYVSSAAIWRADLGLSLDVIFHLVEDEVFEVYMDHLFASSARYVIVYSSDKNAKATHHVRHRKFTTWITQRLPDWQLIQVIPNPYPRDSFCNFFVYRRI